MHLAAIDDCLRSLGDRWGTLCRQRGSTCFIWAEDGEAANGWIEFFDGCVLLTSFGNGKWTLDARDDTVVELVFGGSTYVCLLHKNGRFVVERRDDGCNHSSCSAIGWSAHDELVTPLTNDLGPIWGKLCRMYDTLRFAWAHDGEEVTGWVEIRAGGILYSSFGNGTWELMDDDSSIVEMIFGSSHHLCRLTKHLRFVVEKRYIRVTGKRGQCSAVGWLEAAPSPAPICDSLGPMWGHLCREAGTTRFVWAHDGIEISGWIELKTGGILFTSFANGTWELVEEDTIEMVFGTSVHTCRLNKSGRFILERQYFRGSGKKRISSTVGWPESVKSVTPVRDALGSVWGELCKEYDTTRFSWSNDGKEVSGWINFLDGGVLFTNAGIGTWEARKDDCSVIELIFCSCRYLCRASKSGKFVVEEQYFRHGKRRQEQCFIVGWPESSKQVEPVLDGIGSVWRKVCNDHGTTRFAWSHDGVHVIGWIELIGGGLLLTSFGTGMWQLTDDAHIIEMTFGTSRYVCRLLDDDAKFLVKMQFFRNGQQRSSQAAGWIEDKCGSIANGDGSNKKRRLADGTSMPADGSISGLPRRSVVVVGIAGPSGAGKTLLASEIAAKLNSPIQPVQLDWFFQKEKLAWDPKWGKIWEKPEGVDFKRVRYELGRIVQTFVVAETVPSQLTIYAPNDRLISSAGIDILAAKHAGKQLTRETVFIVVEGFLLFYDDELCKQLDSRLWLDADYDTCLRRRMQRDAKPAPEGIDPAHAEWFKHVVWEHYEKYKGVQLENAPSVAHLDGLKQPHVLVSEAIAHIRSQWSNNLSEANESLSSRIHRMAPLLSTLADGSSVAVISMLGSLCPVTVGHIHCFVEARKMLLGKSDVPRPPKLENFSEALGVIRLNCDDHVSHKMKLSGWPHLELAARQHLVNIATLEHDWLALEERKGAILAALRERWPRLIFTCFTMNGADDVLKYGKVSWGSPEARFITMGRPGYTEKVREAMEQAGVGCDAENFVLGPEIPDISSTLARKALAEGDLDTSSRLLHPDVAKWCQDHWLRRKT